jgi:hypothetical protein
VRIDRLTSCAMSRTAYHLARIPWTMTCRVANRRIPLHTLGTRLGTEYLVRQRGGLRIVSGPSGPNIRPEGGKRRSNERILFSLDGRVDSGTKKVRDSKATASMHIAVFDEITRRDRILGKSQKTRLIIDKSCARGPPGVTAKTALSGLTDRTDGRYQILTDDVRSFAGTEPVGPEGWTAKALLAWEIRRFELLTRPIIASEGLSMEGLVVPHNSSMGLVTSCEDITAADK